MLNENTKTKDKELVSTFIPADTTRALNTYKPGEVISSFKIEVKYYRPPLSAKEFFQL